jgi:hypothetical protein
MRHKQDCDSVQTEYRYDLQAGNRAPGTIRNYTYSLGLFHDWLGARPLATRRSVIDDRIFRREMTMFVRDGELWRRDDETHDNVLIDTSRLPELLARFGVDAEVRHPFGDEALLSGLVAVVGRRRAS